MDSYDPPESIGTKKSTNIPCMTPQWRHKWRHVKNTKITKNRQNHGFSLFFQAKLQFLAMMCVKVCFHMFLLQINQIKMKKHSERVSWNQKTRLCSISIENQFLVSFSLDPALYYAMPRHNPRSDFFLNGLKLSARLEGKKSWSFSAKKITTRLRYNKKMSQGGRIPPPRLF